jgi:hypothetical protein
VTFESCILIKRLIKKNRIAHFNAARIQSTIFSTRYNSNTRALLMLGQTRLHEEQSRLSDTYRNSNDPAISRKILQD